MGASHRPVTDRPEGTFGSLRYAFGGDHPSQTARQAVYPAEGVSARTNGGPYFNGTGQVSGCIRLLSYWHSPVFLLNSCLDLFSAPSLARRDPLSRSYRVSLPSSLTVIHPSASVCSTRPRVSVSVRVPAGWSLADFLGGLVTRAIGEPRRDPRTFRFGSEPGLSWTPQLLHP